MKRTAVLLACLLVPLAPAGAQTPPVAPVAAPAPAGAPPAVAVNDALVTRYIDFQKRVLQVASQEMKKVRAHSGKGRRANREAEAVKLATDVDELAAKITEQVRQEQGLSAAELHAVKGLVNDVMAPRMAWRMSGGDKPLQDMRRQLEHDSGLRRQELEQQIQAMEDNVGRMREARDARALHGDQAVNMVLKHDQEFAQIQDQSLKAGLLRFTQ